jgi:hypothetical protein
VEGNSTNPNNNTSTSTSATTANATSLLAIIEALYATARGRSRCPDGESPPLVGPIFEDNPSRTYGE